MCAVAIFACSRTSQGLLPQHTGSVRSVDRQLHGRVLLHARLAVLRREPVSRRHVLSAWSHAVLGLSWRYDPCVFPRVLRVCPCALQHPTALNYVAHTCAHTHAYTHTHTHSLTHIQSPTHMCAHTHTHMHTLTHVHTRSHTYTHSLMLTPGEACHFVA